MFKFNINNYIYLQITETGWEFLEKTVDKNYINNCIDNEKFRVEIDGEIWYKLQCWKVFDLFKRSFGSETFFDTITMFDDKRPIRNHIKIPQHIKFIIIKI